jgi:hypothetical protein
MADAKISALTGATTPLAGTEEVPVVQGGATRKVSIANLTTGRALSATELTLTTGNLIVSNGKGIDFSATPGTGTSELLSDYEEGTWTPVVADASSGGNTGSFSGSATYTKIGRQVTVRMYISGINTTGMTAGNTLFIRGLPYASSNTAQGNFYTYRVGRDASTVSSCVNMSGGSFFNFALFTVLSATADKTILVSDIVSGTSEIQATITYFV